MTVERKLSVCWARLRVSERQNPSDRDGDELATNAPGGWNTEKAKREPLCRASSVFVQ